ncbi:PREDICTED: prostaglandin F2 receptor negative regulator-like, partial [Nanorana parkeri]|uniref:prostaglandin F2 receptor negative regulator-like n=1 Tax=Nanorana parkeri TaxID=125878 RepID=UPI000853F3E0
MLGPKWRPLSAYPQPGYGGRSLRILSLAMEAALCVSSAWLWRPLSAYPQPGYGGRSLRILSLAMEAALCSSGVSHTRRQHITLLIPPTLGCDESRSGGVTSARGVMRVGVGEASGAVTASHVSDVLGLVRGQRASRELCVLREDYGTPARLRKSRRGSVVGGRVNSPPGWRNLSQNARGCRRAGTRSHEQKPFHPPKGADWLRVTSQAAARSSVCSRNTGRDLGESLLQSLRRRVERECCGGESDAALYHHAAIESSVSWFVPPRARLMPAQRFGWSAPFIPLRGIRTFGVPLVLCLARPAGGLRRRSAPRIIADSFLIDVEILILCNSDLPPPTPHRVIGYNALQASVRLQVTMLCRPLPAAGCNALRASVDDIEMLCSLSRYVALQEPPIIHRGSELCLNPACAGLSVESLPRSHGGEGVAVWSRIVRVPPGPLLRVEGTDIAISCNVSDYEGPRDQNFEWTFSPGSGPAVGVLSTWDETFTDPKLSDRVSAGGIQLQRTGNSEVLLRIRQLKTSDEGNYTCSTPSTDATVSGNYEDHVQLKVISDTLRLQGPKGRTTSARNVTEGGSFQLQCQAGVSEAAAHTHLSLTWERQTAGSASEVLTLTHLGRFQPGPDYAARYGTGEVRLDTAGTDQYRLAVDGALSTDGGEYSCVAQTWVQGPNGWEKIQEKKVGVAQVAVQPMDLTVTLPVKEVKVPEGEPLALSCQVSRDSNVPVLIQARWFRSDGANSQEVLGGPDPEPSPERTVTRKLEVPQARLSGDYTCMTLPTSDLLPGCAISAPRLSASSTKLQRDAAIFLLSALSLSAVPDLQVTLNASVLPQMADEPTELLCHMTAPGEPRLSASWYFTPSQAPDPAAAMLVGSMNQDWTLQAGRFIVSVDFGLAVAARPMQTVSAAGGTFEMMCTVQPKNIPFPQYSVQVTLTPPDSSLAPLNVLSLNREGVIHRMQSAGSHTFLEKGKEGVYTFLEKGKEGVYIFRLHQAQNHNSGAYRCAIVAWTQGGGGAWRMVGNQTSNPVQLEFQNSDFGLAVAARPMQTVSAAGGTFEMMCTVQPKNIPFPQYSVQVTLTPPDSSLAPLNVLSLNREGVIHRMQSAGSHTFLEKGKEGVYTFLEKGKEGVYIFRLHQAQNHNSGAYRCAIVAWTQGGGGAWRMVGNQTSNPVQLEFQNSGPVFNVTAHSDSSSVYLGERAEIWCIVTIDGPAVVPADMAFEVSWYAQRPSGSAVFLALMDRASLVRHGRRNSTSEVSMERISDMEYRLRVYGCEEEDAGGHYCTVTPWVRTGEGGWSRQETLTSSRVAINIKMH